MLYNLSNPMKSYKVKTNLMKYLIFFLNTYKSNNLNSFKILNCICNDFQ